MSVAMAGRSAASAMRAEPDGVLDNVGDGAMQIVRSRRDGDLLGSAANRERKRSQRPNKVRLAASRCHRPGRATVRRQATAPAIHRAMPPKTRPSKLKTSGRALPEVSEV